ncbi:MAG: DUF721 domain-containing protein [Thermodesulfovibrio sp.]|nr:DUF721 domain-containing protein [Thermodesulfovibrio sp.]
MQKIGLVLPSLFNNLGIEDAVKLKFLRKKWNEIFSAPLRDYTYPKEIKEGFLYVTVASHAWLNELKLLKEEFLNRLIPYGIKDVEFKFGKIYNTRKKIETEVKTKNISEQQEQWINDILEKINDEEIRLVFKNLLRKHLANMNEIIKRRKS